jgi:16S rRNA G966 N2-methylase RsmD
MFSNMKNSRLQKLIDQLGSPDAKAADAAGRAIIDLGSETIPVLVQAARINQTSTKRRIAFLLGLLGRKGSSFSTAIQNALLDGLRDEDWKVRRNSAIALGKIGDYASVQRVLNTLKQEDDPRVRTSLILTFGKLAQVSDAPSLQGIVSHSDEERTAVRKVSDRFSTMIGDVPAIDTRAPLLPGVSVELWSRPGVADIVVLEAAARHLNAKMLAPDRVSVRKPRNLDEVLPIRAALFPVLMVDTRNDFADPLALGKKFEESIVVDEMLRLTKGTPVGYRLTIKPNGMHLKLKRRDWIAQFTAGCNRLTNRATGYSWEVIIRSMNERTLIGARPSAINDTRFDYRKSDVPASIHPTLAAAAVRMAPALAGDIIVDPFCGSGTLLAERALLAPYSRLIGIDEEQRALHAARTNLANFERLSLERADFSTLIKYAPVDTIITNPPYGLRVSTQSAARRLHAKLDSLAENSLRPGGTLISFRPPQFPGPSGLEVIKRHRIDAGGLMVDIIVARKRSS